ncbi:MAG TPA: fibronectin type III domain-containing protein [Anaerolineales bacterium]|nr:fibronectin type III domain-containing protein [Anaerolineales bacterium]
MKKESHSRHFLYLAVMIAMLIASITPATVTAQPTQALTEDWRNEDFNFSSRMMDTDRDDNIYVLGDTAAGNFLVIKKFSPGGALLWQTTYDPAERLRGVWIAVDSNGNPVVVATIVTGSYANPAGWLTVKYDTNGNPLWAGSLPGGFNDVRRVAIDANNNIHVAGRMWLPNSSGNTTLDSVLIKYDPAGTRLWTAVFDNNSAIDEPFSLVISADSTRIGVAGISGNAFMALMYDPNGSLLWSRTNANAGPANDLAFGPGNVSYFATSTYFPQDPNPNQMAIRKFDAAGNQLWLNSYGVGDRTLRVRVDGQGNVVATGVDYVGYSDWMTIKTDSNGTLLWSRRYDGGRNNDEIPSMLVLDSSGAVYVTGTGGPNPSTGTVSYLKGVIVKYNAAGSPQWAVWDPYANGLAIRPGAGNTLASLGFGYLVVTHYTQTGLPDVLPASPTNLSGLVGSTGGPFVNLYFTDNASNEFWVDVERCTGAGCTNFARVGQTLGENATGFKDTTVAQGVTYTYRVRAVGFMGLSGYSNTVQVSLASPSLPTAPGNLTAAMNGVNVVLNWQDNSTNEIDFYVERCQGVNCTNFIGLGTSGGANIATWTDYNASAGQSYSYRVRAWNSDGFSNYSNTATIITPGGTPATPPAPSSLAAQTFSHSQIHLTWTNNTSNQDGVIIERCRGANCNNFSQIAIVSGASYTDTGLLANTTYRYRVRAYNSAGNSPYSNVASAKTLRR